MQIEQPSIYNKLKNAIKEGISTKRFSLQERAVLFKQLATLIMAGIPLRRSLTALLKQHPKEPVKGIIEDIFVSISKGGSFSNALASRPGFFDMHTIALISAGEQQGDLGLALKRLADSYEAKLELMRSISNAFAYPMFVLISSLIITILLIHFTLPSIETTLYTLNVPIPPLTRAAITLFSFFRSPFSIVAVIAIIAVAFKISKIYLKITDNRKRFEHFLYKLPLFKKTLTTINGIRFCQIMSDLHASGLPLMTSLSHISMTMESVLAQDEIQNVIVQVVKGKMLSEAIAEGKMFPRLIGSMLSVGEQTGELSSLLRHTHSYLATNMHYALEKVKQSIGPVLILTLGLIITLFIMVFFVPIYDGLESMTL